VDADDEEEELQDDEEVQDDEDEVARPYKTGGDVYRSLGEVFMAHTEAAVIEMMRNEQQRKRRLADMSEAAIAAKKAEKEEKKQNKVSQLHSAATSAWSKTAAASDDMADYLRGLKQQELRKICRWAYWQACGKDDAKALACKRGTTAADKLARTLTLTTESLANDRVTVPVLDSGRWRLPDIDAAT
jgi:hypothetical protein